LTRCDPRSEPQSAVDLLTRCAAEKPHAKAFVFVPDRGEHIHLTFGELDRRARAVALRLVRRTVRGDRALFLFPPGLDFIVAFFGCLAAGVIAVPLMVPRRTEARDSSATIIADCAPKIAMTTGELLDGRPDVAERFRESDFDWMTVSAIHDAPEAPDGTLPPVDRNDLAFLQYTSGSTSTP
jgi:acyl-CoA synthetase (AMP-forming)/AMP-acid ligase II